MNCSRFSLKRFGMAWPEADEDFWWELPGSFPVRVRKTRLNPTTRIIDRHTPQ